MRSVFINKIDAAAEIGRNPVSKYQIRLEYGKRAGWRGTGRPNLSCVAKILGANGDREIFIIFPVQLTTSRTGNFTRLIHTLLMVMLNILIGHVICETCPRQVRCIT